MKITHKILSIPPYISTSWTYVAALKMEQDVLVITLTSQEVIRIPHLPKDCIHQIFEAHALHMEQTSLPASPLKPTEENTFRFGINLGDGMSTIMQHNPEQSDAPDLPPEILERIAMIAKMVSPEEMTLISKAVSNCNCMYCQLARAVCGNQEEPSLQTADEEDPVSEEDLNFCQWHILSKGNNLYTVTNKLDEHESYTVFLGEPVGCTCGRTGCEHVLAVLRN